MIRLECSQFDFGPAVCLHGCQNFFSLQNYLFCFKLWRSPLRAIYTHIDINVAEAIHLGKWAESLSSSQTSASSHFCFSFYRKNPIRPSTVLHFVALFHRLVRTANDNSRFEPRAVIDIFARRNARLAVLPSVGRSIHRHRLASP